MSFIPDKMWWCGWSQAWRATPCHEYEFNMHTTDLHGCGWVPAGDDDE